MKALLLTILVVAAGGLVFSGYLSYRELFATATVVECTPIGAPGSMLGAPPCIYGFVMYLTLVVLAAIGLVRLRARA